MDGSKITKQEYNRYWDKVIVIGQKMEQSIVDQDGDSLMYYLENITGSILYKKEYDRLFKEIEKKE